MNKIQIKTEILNLRRALLQRIGKSVKLEKVKLKRLLGSLK